MTMLVHHCSEEDICYLNVSHPSTIRVSIPTTCVVLSCNIEIIQILQPTITRIPGGPCRRNKQSSSSSQEEWVSLLIYQTCRTVNINIILHIFIIRNINTYYDQYFKLSVPTSVVPSAFTSSVDWYSPLPPTRRTSPLDVVQLVWS